MVNDKTNVYSYIYKIYNATYSEHNIQIIFCNSFFKSKKSALNGIKRKLIDIGIPEYDIGISNEKSSLTSLLDYEDKRIILTPLPKKDKAILFSAIAERTYYIKKSIGEKSIVIEPPKREEDKVFKENVIVTYHLKKSILSEEWIQMVFLSNENYLYSVINS